MCLDLHHLPYASLPAHMEEQGRGGRRTPGSPLPRPGGGDSKWAGGPGSHAKEAPRSTTGSPVSPSMYGLRTPQRLGAGRIESRVGEGVKEAQDRWGTGADPGEPLDPHPTPARPFSLLYLDSIPVNLLIRDLPGAVPPHLGDRGLVFETIIQAEGRNHVLKPLGAGDRESK